MRNIEEIILDKVYLCVLDRDNKNIILPSNALNLNEQSYEFFEKHILKCLKDDEAKTGIFFGETNIVRELCGEVFLYEDEFITNSKKLAHMLYKSICNDDAKSGDFAICVFESSSSKYLALLKLEYSSSYVHYIRQCDEDIIVDIEKSSNALPLPTNKLQKAAIIKNKMQDEQYDLLLIDKDFDSYFSKSFLNASGVRDRRENTKIIRNVSEKIARKAFRDNAKEAEEFRSSISEVLTKEEKIDIDALIHESVKDNNVKEEFRAALKSENILENELKIDREWAQKKLKRKRLKVDKSIELYIDSEIYNDSDKFEIKRNGDGTIDIILKNVKNYIEK